MHANDDAGAIRLQGVSVAFGGLQAVGDVSLEVAAGELLGVIGPNGAGKTTLINLISGDARADSGTVVVAGRDVTRAPVHRRARLGLARSYQATTTFPGLTVQENVELAVAARTTSHYALRHRAASRRRIRSTCSEALGATGLEASRSAKAGDLGHGQARALEIAMLLACGARIMLLDEPAAGMAAGEVAGIIDTIRRVREHTGATIVLVEHKIGMVFGLSDRIAVLDQGRLVAIGPPAEIAADATVRRAYLGESTNVG